VTSGRNPLPRLSRRAVDRLPESLPGGEIGIFLFQCFELRMFLHVLVHRNALNGLRGEKRCLNTF